MKTSARGIQFIKDREAFRARAYKPTPVDRWTVGYGFTEIDGRPVRDGDTMTKEEAERRFPEILAPYEHAVNLQCPTPTNQNQFDAMVSLCFNIGIGSKDDPKKRGFYWSTVRRAHNAGNYEAATNAFGLFVKQNGETLPGLVTRRRLESLVYNEPLSGAYVPPMPQTVDPEPKFTASGINRGGIAATVVTAGAAVQPVLDTINAVKTGTDGLGTWAVPVLLVLAVACIGYMVYERIQLRKRGQA